MRRLLSLSGSVVVGVGLLVANRSIAFAGVGVWTTGGPHGDPLADYVSVVSDSRVAGLVYAGSANGLFKSLDNGVTWFPAGLAGQVATPLATGPEGVILVSAGYRVPILYQSTDGGNNWISVPQGEFTYKAAVDPVTSTTLYRVSAPPISGVPPELTPSSLWRSFDGGLTWAVIDPPGKDAGPFGDLVVDPRISGTLYVIAPVEVITGNPNLPPIVAAHILKTVDSGSSWVEIDAPGGGQRLAIDPITPSTLYLASSNAAYKTVDGGRTFSEITVLDLFVSEIRVDPQRSNRVYAAAGGTVVASEDGGSHWWPLTLSYAIDLTIDATGTFLHVATGSAVFDYQVPERLPVEPPQQNFRTRVLPARPTATTP